MVMPQQDISFWQAQVQYRKELIKRGETSDLMGRLTWSLMRVVLLLLTLVFRRSVSRGRSRILQRRNRRSSESDSTWPVREDRAVSAFSLTPDHWPSRS